MSKLTEKRNILVSTFPNAKDDILLAIYPCVYWPSPSVSLKGNWSIGRDSCYFLCIGESEPVTEDFKVSISYRIVSKLSLVCFERTVDSIEIIVRNQIHNFVMNLNKKDVFRLVSSLCNAAMNRLIKGAENSISSSSEMFAKPHSNATGDLAINVKPRGAPFLIGMQDENSAHFTNDASEDGMEMDFSMLSTSNEPNKCIPTAAVHYKTVERYSHIKIGLIRSLADLNMQIRQLEFRNLFRLAYEEAILTEEANVYYFSKIEGAGGSTSVMGNLYLSQSFLNFASVPPSSNTSTGSTSLLFDSVEDVAMLYSIPYSHIVSVQKHPPTKLASSGKLVSLSGYLVVSTKNRAEFWLSFSNVKARDRLSELILSRIKTVDWKFDGDLIIGGRNGPLYASKSDPTRSGLSFLYGSKTDRVGDISVVLWASYFELYGKDVCIVKDLPRLRNLLLKTHGVPDLFRGDFWMLVSGAWTSRPAQGYYASLVAIKSPSPFAEEIEKDVRR